MRDFGRFLEDEVEDYEGPYAELLRQAPTMYRLLTGVLQDPDLPRGKRPLILSSISYFILPFDVIPEDVHGARGYLDDLYLTAYVAKDVSRDLGDDILVRNWSGREEVTTFIDRVLDQSEDYFDEPALREDVLRFIGYDKLVDEPRQ